MYKVSVLNVAKGVLYVSNQNFCIYEMRMTLGQKFRLMKPVIINAAKFQYFQYRTIT
jgi:hypothetical protein